MSSPDPAQPTDNSDGGDQPNFPANPVEEELERAIAAGNAAAAESDGENPEDTTEEHATQAVARFLGGLKDGELWVPLPEGAGQQDDGSIALPTLDVEGTTFIPAFTSEEQFEINSSELPRARLPVQDLTSVLPSGVGIVLNPGNDTSVPLYPAMVDTLRGEASAAADGNDEA